MIVSALLTSVGINLLLTILLFALYSFLRNLPSYLPIYAPRLLSQGNNALPGVGGWVRAAWGLTEEDLLEISGLDGVVFIRIFVFCLRVFSVAGIIGIFILVPINYLGDQLSTIDWSDIPNKSLDLFSISNVDDGSSRLWFHFSAAYILTAFVCYLLYNEYKYISSKRLDYFMKSAPKLHEFTILVRGIPIQNGISISQTVQNFFTEFYPNDYLSHVVVHHTSKLRHLIKDAEGVYRNLTHMKSIGRERNNKGGICGLFRKKDKVLDYEKKLEDLEQNVRLQQSDISTYGEEVPAAFVCFKSRFSTATSLSLSLSSDPTRWVTEQAPEPSDIYWPFFSTSFIQRWISKFVVFLFMVFLIILFLIVAAFVQGLTYLDQLEAWLPFLGKILKIILDYLVLDRLEAQMPFLEKILKLAVVSQVITGYLPSLLLHLLSSQIPPLMKLFSTMQGFISTSSIEQSACTKMLWFTIWSIFFANVLTGSVTSQLAILLDPKDIPSLLALVVPAQATFYIAYVVTSWTSISSELTQTMALFNYIFTCPCSQNNNDKEINVQSISYHSEIPRILLFGLLGFTYFILSPLILPFILVYFCTGYIIYRNQLMNVYSPKYETGGKFWPIVHNTTIFSLILMHLIAIGIFGLKKLPIASSLIVPLPILTLLFNEYCNKRFLPIFKAYSAEDLMKKDREDVSNRNMSEFFRKLVSAYKDPALAPIDHININERNIPLLS